MKIAALFLLCGSVPVFGQGIERISVASGGKQVHAQSGDPSVSWDGRYVAFASDADNLVPGDTNGVSDVFVHDAQLGRTERVSMGYLGQQGNAESCQPSISARGRFVVFTSHASNLVPLDTPGTVDVFIHDRQTDATQCVTYTPAWVLGTGGTGAAGEPVVSPNGRYIAFESQADDLVAGQPPAPLQVYIRDIWAGITECVSVDNAGVPGHVPSSGPSMSADARYVAFTSYESFFSTGPAVVHSVLVRDRQTNTTTMIPSPGSETDQPSFSLDGRYLAFRRFDIQSPYFNIVRHDILLGTTTLVSHGPGGAFADRDCNRPSLSPNGRYVSYHSAASNILPATGTSPHNSHVFRWGALDDETKLVSANASGEPGDWNSRRSSVSLFGQVAFESMANNLVPLDTNGVQDVFLKAP